MKRLRKLVVAVALIVLIYILSIGPAVYWVRHPIVTDRSLEAFDSYDWRLDRYFTLYWPIVLLRARSEKIHSLFGSYEAQFQPRLKTESGLVLGNVEHSTGFFKQVPTVATDARGTLRSQGLVFRSGYAFYLPRSGMLVAAGRQVDIDVLQVFSSHWDPERFAVWFY